MYSGVGGVKWGWVWGVRRFGWCMCNVRMGTGSDAKKNIIFCSVFFCLKKKRFFSVFLFFLIDMFIKKNIIKFT